MSKKKIATMSEVIEYLEKIMKLPLMAYSDKELADVALENAQRFGITAYDGLYVALSELYLAPLVTADEKLFKACRNRFHFIESLRDMKLP